MPAQSRSDAYRMRAQLCEQRAKDAPDVITQEEWEDLAMEWHTLASFAERETGGKAPTN